jgi:hypothetical protein
VYDHIWQSPLKRGAMSYQRGSLRNVKRKEGEIWVLQYRVTNSDGRRVENVMPIGLVQQFPKDKDAWREADPLTASLHTGPDLCRYGAPCFGDPGATLVGLAVE